MQRQASETTKHSCDDDILNTSGRIAMAEEEEVDLIAELHDEMRYSTSWPYLST